MSNIIHKRLAAITLTLGYWVYDLLPVSIAQLFSQIHKVRGGSLWWSATQVKKKKDF